MKRSKLQEPFCGFPYGFHEFASLPEMPEDDCCVHCGQPRHEIESSQQDQSTRPDDAWVCPDCGQRVRAADNLYHKPCGRKSSGG